MRRERPRTPVRLLTLTATVLAACGGSAGDHAVRSDSAGVTIVDSRRAEWSRGGGWRIEAAPATSIGLTDGPEAYLFDGAHAVRLTDGRFAVTDAGAQQLRIFAPDGRHLTSWGRRGGGPGEFENIGRPVLLPGDSILVLDLQQRRFSILTADAGYVRAVRMPEGLPGIAIEGMIGNSAVGWLPDFVRDHAGPDGVQRMTAALLRVHLDGSGFDTIGIFAHSEIVRSAGSSHSTPFGPHAVLVPLADGFWYGYPERYEIGRYDVDGRLRMLARREYSPVPVPATLQAGSQRPDASPQPEPPRPAHMPAYSTALADAAGNVWLASFPSRDWSVFDGGGRYLGDVAMPDRFRPLQIGDDFVLGISYDEFMVERVVLYRLVKRDRKES